MALVDSTQVALDCFISLLCPFWTILVSAVNSHLSLFVLHGLFVQCSFSKVLFKTVIKSNSLRVKKQKYIDRKLEENATKVVKNVYFIIYIKAI